MIFGVDLFAVAGTFCLGIVVIWIVKLFAVKLGKPEIKWLTVLLAALLGGAVLGFLGHVSEQKTVWPHEFWFYPIGMVVGLFLFSDTTQGEMPRPD
jgi:xanthine/uracil permease